MKILLACCSGMSTSLVVNKMKDAAKKDGRDDEIWAVSHYVKSLMDMKRSPARAQFLKDIEAANK